MATAPTTTAKAVKGGSFLLEDRAPEEVFTPEDFTDEQRQIGQMTEEFMTNEVLPQGEKIEHGDKKLLIELMHKAAELGLMGADVPEAYGGAGLDKVSSTVIAEKMARYASFAVSHGGHAGIGTLPIAYFGTEEQRQKYT